jgi:hypothetical protein
MRGAGDHFETVGQAGFVRAEHTEARQRPYDPKRLD